MPLHTAVVLVAARTADCTATAVVRILLVLVDTVAVHLSVVQMLVVDDIDQTW